MDQSARHNWLVKVQSERSGADDGCSRTEAPRWCFCGLTEWPRKCFVLVFAAFRWGSGDFLRRRQPTPEGSLSFHLVRLEQLQCSSESAVKTCKATAGQAGLAPVYWKTHRKRIIWLKWNKNRFKRAPIKALRIYFWFSGLCEVLCIQWHLARITADSWTFCMYFSSLGWKWLTCYRWRHHTVRAARRGTEAASVCLLLANIPAASAAP